MSSCETASRNDACCNREDSVDSRFSCHICFDEVTEPVVTRCGHMYCWPCLFQWLEPGMRYEERASLGMPPSPFCDDSRRVCAVCKSECPLSSIVPVFVRARATVSAPDSEQTDEGEEADIGNENNGGGQQLTTGTQNPTNDESGASGSENDTNNNAAAAAAAANGLDFNEIAAQGGLRRRRIPNRSPVPNRPSVAHVPQQAPEQPEPASPTLSNRSSPGSSPQMSASIPYRLGGLAPRSPNGHNASLTHGILLSLQRATADYYRNNSGNDSEADRQRQIPSLHDLNRNDWGDHEGSQGHSGVGTTINVNSETTQYLSRLLIMLTSFVIFCFLLV
mmetsp:Transcript_11587/g.33341  ORF Transcript_11587/g.33341 Transcript_11587/m.33341 type:complete len:335 (-) Transcript_11587:622-1626(-)